MDGFDENRLASVGGSNGAAERHLLQVFDPPGLDGRADQFMLSVEAGGKEFLVKISLEEVIVRQPLARENCPAVVDQRQNYRLRETFVFGLHVVRNPIEFYVCVVASYHGVTD